MFIEGLTETALCGEESGQKGKVAWLKYRVRGWQSLNQQEKRDLCLYGGASGAQLVEVIKQSPPPYFPWKIMLDFRETWPEDVQAAMFRLAPPHVQLRLLAKGIEHGAENSESPVVKEVLTWNSSERDLRVAANREKLWAWFTDIAGEDRMSVSADEPWLNFSGLPQKYEDAYSEMMRYDLHDHILKPWGRYSNATLVGEAKMWEWCHDDNGNYISMYRGQGRYRQECRWGEEENVFLETEEGKIQDSFNGLIDFVVTMGVIVDVIQGIKSWNSGYNETTYQLEWLHEEVRQDISDEIQDEGWLKELLGFHAAKGSAKWEAIVEEWEGMREDECTVETILEWFENFKGIEAVKVATLLDKVTDVM